MTSSPWLAALALVTLSGPASAACCYFSAKNADILQPAQKVFLTYNPAEKMETFTVQPRFEGNALDFSMVIPTPSQWARKLTSEYLKVLTGEAPHSEKVPDVDEGFTQADMKDAKKAEAIRKLIESRLADADFHWQVRGEGTDEKGLQKLLANSPDLERLRVGWPGISDPTMKDIARFKSLSHLQISNSSRTTMQGTEQVAVTPTGVKELAKLNSLRVLNIGNVPLNDEALKEIGKLIGLKTLCLGHCKVSDDGVKHLAGLHLTGLNLVASPITDTALRELGKLQPLELLDVSQSKTTDAGVKELRGLARLRYLNLNHTEVTDESLKHLAELKTLRTLDLRQTKVTEKGIEWLRTKNRQIQFILPEICEPPA